MLNLTGMLKAPAGACRPKRLTSTPKLAERFDVALKRVQHSIYINTDLAARFVMNEISAQAQQARNAA